MIFSLMTTFVMSQKFWYVVLSLSVISVYLLIFFFLPWPSYSSVACCWISMDLCSSWFLFAVDLWFQTIMIREYDCYAFIPKQLLIYSSLVHKEHFQELTTCWDTNILNKYQRAEIIPTIFSVHNALILEISCKKKAERTTNTWRLNNMLLKSNWVR